MKKILRRFALIMLVVLPATAHAQKCDLDKNEKDPYTNEVVKSGTCKIAPALWHWKLTLTKSGDKYRWGMQIKYGKHFQNDLKSGDVIYCKLKNGKVVKLVCDNDYAPSHVASPDGFITTTYLPQGNMDESDMKNFAESPMDGIRVMIAGTNMEPNISGKQGENVQEIAMCILKD